MAPPAVSFRPMTVADIPEVMQVEEASFSAPWTRQAFFNELCHNQFADYTVVEKAKRVIGYIGMWLIVNEAHITNIAIAPDYRGQGIGKETMEYAMKRAWRLGAESMTLEVRVSNHIAQRLYQKMGFASSGLRPRYYTDNQEDAMIMWARLNGGSDEGTTMQDTGNRNELR
ncbi:ribosomal protein S18-alanine N-acetyltransferase [Desmospora activa]|uniref:[SSU ribosomal protein S18P]-alanine acetyltransferase n=1 Tax=Desmospora activa DSM 45169 TaxID=1121389 RepID=A0A2T4Z0H8_9BACL|nr:ribosomal protein S18-alanine N-acetyltransferase [Desmospora activa]PTM53247.1 [SSU ribosomal protein S18P]-alanine acetyltransferase [Desmospora activa DSM 45169]